MIACDNTNWWVVPPIRLGLSELSLCKDDWRFYDEWIRINRVAKLVWGAWVFIFCRQGCARVKYLPAVVKSTPRPRFNSAIEWFHYKCVGLRRKPRGKWFCEACRKARKASQQKRPAPAAAMQQQQQKQQQQRLAVAQLVATGFLDSSQLEFLVGAQSPPGLLARFCTAAAFFDPTRQSSPGLVKQALAQLLVKEGYQCQPPSPPKATAEPEFEISKTLSAEELLQQRANEASSSGKMIDLSASTHAAPCAPRATNAAPQAKATGAAAKAKVEYSSWRVKELKRELGSRQLSTRGLKAELVRRLESHDACASTKPPEPVSKPMTGCSTTSACSTTTSMTRRTTTVTTKPISPVTFPAIYASTPVSAPVARAPPALDAKQQEVLDRIVAGDNVFFTGSAGM